MRLLVLPGVLRPPSDARLLTRTMRELRLARDADVADVFTGSGVLAIAAAGAGARSVWAVDISRRACLNARVNSALHGARIRVRRGDVLAPLMGARFDLILANPPYVPSVAARAPRGAARAWEGGADGRALVDRLCAEAPARLRPGGSILLVHSALTGVPQTLAALARYGLEARVVARARGSLGPIMAARAAALEARGLLAPGEREEEIVVIRGTAPRRLDTVRATMPAVSESP